MEQLQANPMVHPVYVFLASFPLPSVFRLTKDPL